MYAVQEGSPWKLLVQTPPGVFLCGVCIFSLYVCELSGDSKSAMNVK